MIKAFFLVLAMLLGTTLVQSQDRLQLVTVKLTKEVELRRIQQMDFDVAGVEYLNDQFSAMNLLPAKRGALVDIIVNARELDRLKRNYFHPVEVLEIPFQNKRQIRKLLKNNFDIAKIRPVQNGFVMDVIVDKNEQYDARNKLISLGFDTQPLLLSSGGKKSPGSGSTSGLDERYKNPQEIEELVHAFHQKYPHISKVVKIGNSHEGRPIWALRITDRPNENEKGEHAVLFNSMHHAREIITPEVSLDIIEYLLVNYNQSEKVRFWVDNLDIWVVPMLNVDGNAKVWSGNSFWRKNTRDGHGVDLNRNYPAKDWGACRGSSGSKWSDTYRGHEPGSEIETKVLMKLVSEIRPVFDISYHSYSNMVIYPLGCEGKRVADIKLIEGIGNHLGKLLDYSAGTGWDLLYSTDGGDIDWMYERWGVIPFVLELTSRRTGFHPPYSKRQPTVERNRAGWQFLLDRMFMGGVELEVNPEAAGAKVQVIEKTGGKKLSRYEVKKDGTLLMMLVPGSYKIVIEKAGKTEIREVNIGDKLVGIKANL